MGNSKKGNIIIFIIIIASFEFLFEWIYYVMTGLDDESFYKGLISDLPFVLIMAFVSLLIVHTSNKYFKYKDNIYIRVSFELFVSLIFACTYSFLLNYVFGNLFFEEAVYPELPSLIILVLGNSFIILVLELFFYNQRQLESQKHIAVIEKEKIEYLYSTLKTQVHPHFLFNSLNVLSSLIFEDPQRANIYTKKLSNVYRYFLSTNTQKSVLVKDEISFVESYLYLLLIRFEDALEINITGNREIQKQVIPVSIQLLIENAIKHNVVSVDRPLLVEVNITSECIEVTNNMQPRLNVEESGHGLSNLQKQYTLYGKEIEVSKTTSQFVVKIPYL
ncbi:sensor histidine kinase [Dysgonomonas sp. HGC4]|uniref:sensor histidine kinase n=1 Tax=Dysgonomonas sp. HGC4 TaxID=1658009 RepID=UPI000A3FA613|nr:histidine kinase [Dysgonomonas sp. HGC4]MBD8347232.1 histidine kinase [Dysgonomonas sp. HGC4]